MTTPQIYTSLLRLSLPWYISRIDIDIEKEEAHVYITHHHEKMACPACGVKCAVRDHGEGERVWRHLDLWQAKTFLHASMPRIDCDKHGVLTVPVPWAEPGSRFSMGFESRVISALISTRSVEGASAITGNDTRDLVILPSGPIKFSVPFVDDETIASYLAPFIALNQPVTINPYHCLSGKGAIASLPISPEPDDLLTSFSFPAPNRLANAFNQLGRQNVTIYGTDGFTQFPAHSPPRYLDIVNSETSDRSVPSFTQVPHP